MQERLGPGKSRPRPVDQGANCQLTVTAEPERKQSGQQWAQWQPSRGCLLRARRAVLHTGLNFVTTLLGGAGISLFHSLGNRGSEWIVPRAWSL